MELGWLWYAQDSPQGVNRIVQAASSTANQPAFLKAL
jgi:hypothetical protein